MNKKVTFLVSLVLLIVLFAPAQLVMAQNATAETWTSAIVYFNTSADSGTMSVTFYSGATSYPSADIAVNGQQNGTILVGSVSTTPSLPASFSGSAILSATVPLAVVHYDYSINNPDTYDRAFYTGFDASQASDTIYVTTAEKTAWGQVTTSRFGIQNIEASADAYVTFHFITVGETSDFFTKTQTIAPSASYYFSLLDSDFSSIPDNWTGSLKITTDPSANILVAAEQTSSAYRYTYAFEGVKTGANTIYVPTMLCHYGIHDQTSYYAVQAAGGTASISVKHYDRDTGLQLGSTYPASVPDGAKEIINPCLQGSVPNGAIGSSIITSTGAPVNVSVKVNGTDGLRTAYIAQGSGSTEVALPYVSWNDDVTADFRTYISVMNISETTNGRDIVATYYNENGTVKTTHTLAADEATQLGSLQKINTYLELLGGGNWKGAVKITSDVPIFVTARSHKTYTGLEPTAVQMGEDYTAVSIP